MAFTASLASPHLPLRWFLHTIPCHAPTDQTGQPIPCRPRESYDIYIKTPKYQRKKLRTHHTIPRTAHPRLLTHSTHSILPLSVDTYTPTHTTPHHTTTTTTTTTPPPHPSVSQSASHIPFPPTTDWLKPRPTHHRTHAQRGAPIRSLRSLGSGSSAEGVLRREDVQHITSPRTVEAWYGVGVEKHSRHSHSPADMLTGSRPAFTLSVFALPI